MMEFHTHQQSEAMVVGHGEIVVGGVRPCPFHVVGFAQRSAGGVVVDNVGMEGVVDRMDEALVIVNAEV